MSELPDDRLRLVDGSPPMTSDALLEKLRRDGFDCPTVEHPPMFTVEDSKSLRVTPEGRGDIKNLFLRNKKGQMWLVSCHEDRLIDLKRLAAGLGAGRFSFCSEQRLMHYLGVTPGSVSPLALINDTSRVVKFFIDRALLEVAEIYLHPLINTRTTTIRTADLLSFAISSGHPPGVLTFLEDRVDCHEPLDRKEYLYDSPL